MFPTVSSTLQTCGATYGATIRRGATYGATIRHAAPLQRHNPRVRTKRTVAISESHRVGYRSNAPTTAATEDPPMPSNLHVRIGKKKTRLVPPVGSGVPRAA